jgi:arylsulfatase A-like enzyme
MEDDLLTLRRNATAAERSHLDSQYDGALTYLDAEIGKLVERLKQTGVYSKTLLVITADHGEALGERSLVGHGVSVYQDQVHVPLLIKFPSEAGTVQAGIKVKGPVSSVDLLPTIFDTLAYSVPPGLQGHSLRSRSPHQDLLHPVFSESFPSLRLINLQPRLNRVDRAVFSGSLKLIRSLQGNHELYDLARDPDEAQDIYASAGSSASRLETSLVKWVEASAGQAQTVPKLERGTVEKLRSLGYVQ